MNTTETASPQEQARQRTQHLMGTPDPREESPAISVLRQRITSLQWSGGKQHWEQKLADAQKNIDEAVKTREELEADHRFCQQEITQLEAAIETLKKESP